MEPVDLLIRGRALLDGRYRGIDRTWPYHVDGLRDDHPANQAFFWFCEEGGELGIVHDLAAALQLVDVYGALTPPQTFEIVEATSGEQRPQAASREFLGFDLSAGCATSLLSWGLEIGRAPTGEVPQDDLLWTLHPLLRLIKTHFQPQLNANGLFTHRETAGFCLACMMALQKIRPNLFENDSVRFEVVGLWLVR